MQALGASTRRLGAQLEHLAWRRAPSTPAAHFASGLATLRTTAYNQHRQPVLELTAAVLMPRRPE